MTGLAFVGGTTLDVIERPGVPPVTKPGGAPRFVVDALAMHGVTVPVATWARSATRVAGLARRTQPLCLRLDRSEMVSILRYRANGERAHTIGGLAPPVTDADVEGWIAPALRDAGWVVIGTQHGGDVTPDALAALARGGRSLVLDAQGPLREPRLGPLRLRSELDLALLPHVRVLKLSEEEAQAAFGTLDPADIARRCGVAEVLVTLGRSGARASAAGESRTVPATRIDGVDPTGAGDAFLALFARARAGGAAPLDATERACSDVGAWLAARS